MEDALVPLLLRPHGCEVVSLNPCFNGRCTSTSVKGLKVKGVNVLILVLMEDALVQECKEP